MLKRFKETSRLRQSTLRIIENLPLTLPIGLAAFSVVATTLLLFNKLDNMLVWPIGLSVAVISALVVHRSIGSRVYEHAKERNACNLLVLIGVGLWVLFNLFFASQHLMTNRDPGVYATTGAWLVKQNNLQLAASDSFEKTTLVNSYSGGFSPDPDNATQKVVPQGLHLLPIFIGLTGRILGTARMFLVNVLIGGLALLALYGFIRNLARPVWALAVVTGVALTLPMIYFARDTYTEPLALLFTFSTFSLLWAAQRSKRATLWLYAGLLAGAGALTRIDAFLTIACLIFAALVLLAFAPPEARKKSVVLTLLFILGISVTATLGFLDLYQLSPSYYLSEWRNIKPEFFALVASGVAGVLIIILSWRTHLLQLLDARTKRWRTNVLVLSLCVAGLILASRPLWYVSTKPSRILSADGAIVTIMKRNYAEATINWMAWYLGPIAVVAGFVGLLLLARKMMKGNFKFLFPFLLVWCGTSLLYLTRPGISPDQVWASRRLMPVILPGLAAMAAVGFEWLYGKKKIWHLRVDGKTSAIVLASLSAVAPLFISRPFLFIKEAAWYAPVESVCKAAPKNSAILYVGAARSRLVEPTKALCGLPSEGFGRLFINTDSIDKPTLILAANNARARGLIPLVGQLSSDQATSGLDGLKMTTLDSYTYNTVQTSNEHPPAIYRTSTDAVMLGVIQPDGTTSQLR